MFVLRTTAESNKICCFYHSSVLNLIFCSNKFLIWICNRDKSFYPVLEVLIFPCLYMSLRFDYSVNPDRVNRFYPEIRKYFPDLKDGSLDPGYSGIRPKLSGPKQPQMDFVIQVPCIP